jgi:hypothetical protein
MNSSKHDYNFVLGTQTIGVVYQFTEKTRLVETAEGILGMGSNLLKICMGRSYSQGHYSLPKNEDIRSLKDLATLEPSFRHVLEMPFSIYHLWVYPFSSGPWQDGFSAEDQVREYREIYEFAAYLMERFHGTGKTFFFGHWEGDWYLHPGYKAEMDPDPALIKNMILWLQVRQKAVDEARRDHPDSDVRIYHYTEANLVQKAMQGKSCLVNDVLPNVPVDFVSYSSYDIIIPHRENVRQPLFDALDFIDAKLPQKSGITDKRVFIGEYGFPLELTGTPEAQDRFSRDVCRAALEWGCPFALYWEFYCNEIKEGRHRGFWLINDRNEKQPFYFTLQSFYEKARALVNSSTLESGRVPTREEFTAIALTWLD